MWKERLLRRSLPAVRRDLEELSAIGCDLVRFAVPDLASAQLLGELAATTAMPLVADIHFDYRIALACLDHPLAKVRINPGNIGEEWKVREVISKARDTGHLASDRGERGVASAAAPASQEPGQCPSQGGGTGNGITGEAEVHVRCILAEILRHRFDDTGEHPVLPKIRLSTAHRHDRGGTARFRASSAIQSGFPPFCRRGSATLSEFPFPRSPREEVLTAVEILRAAKARDQGVRLISCPRCGRASLDVHAFLEQVNFSIQRIKKPLVIAVMGCAVNGPGEARHADIGIAGAGKMAIIFKAGEVVRRVSHQQAAKVFLEEIDKLCVQQ